jgi:hypothetical protein
MGHFKTKTGLHALFLFEKNRADGVTSSGSTESTWTI